MSDNALHQGRRRFLKTAAVAGAATTVAAVGTGAGAATAERDTGAGAAEAPQAKGYHVTRHIETYYRLARQ